MAAASFKYLVFLFLIALIAFGAYALFVFKDTVLSNAVWIVSLVVFVWIIYKFDFILQLLDYQRAVIYRFGKVNRVGGPGWAWVWPIIEHYDPVDLRVKTIDVPKQNVVTKDGIEITVDAIVYLKVKKDNQSVVNSVIEVEDYVQASQLFIVSSLRDVIGSVPLSDAISSIDVINAKIKENLAQVSKDWGIAIESIEISNIEIPETILQAMHDEKAAVQQKLARMERALAHKAEIDAVREATSKLDEKALAYYYIKAIEGMANSKGSKVFFPSEFTRLAQSFADSTTSKKSAVPATLAPYKNLLKTYVDSAVKKSGVAKKKKKKK